jgi:2-polyprenyl-6-methoxyphenol hydroxylase-like FAD-dependent oxidoreductase
VVIVGASPVGMFLALDLASHGIRSTVTEQNTTYRFCPKGNTHNPLG